ncbi:MAG: glycosyltransferase family 1 protein [Rikenellaceae bacterium]
MKIAIEAQRIFRTNKHGMDFVALEMIRELQKIDKTNEYFILVSPGDDHCLEGSENMHIVEVKCPTYPLWEQWALPMAVRRIKPDLLHCTSNTAPLFCNVPLVVTLHDIIFLEKRQSASKSIYQNMGWYYRRFVVPRILPHCRKIITVSEFERGRIEKALPETRGKLVAIHNGYSNHFRPIENSLEVTKKYIDSDRYLFFLGNTDPKKNTPNTLKAYAIYVSRTENPLPLLIADLNRTIVENILKEENIEQIKNNIFCPGYISNRDLPYLYSGARVFLYTSLRESFGIPLLEAMACGTPVVTSSTSAIPEVAGEGAILTNPNDPEDIAAAIIRLESDNNYRESQRSYGLERVKKFSWQNTAMKVLNLYKSI